MPKHVKIADRTNGDLLRSTRTAAARREIETRRCPQCGDLRVQAERRYYRTGLCSACVARAASYKLGRLPDANMSLMELDALIANGEDAHDAAL